MAENFLKQIHEQLKRMTEAEKDAWILTQAKLIPADKQDDFVLSLTGKKAVFNMPSEKEIAEFCRKAETGEIYFEYETHYYEFDDDGRYMDDWKVD